MAHVDVTSFAEIGDEFRERVEKMVWCHLATVDANNRPRSRPARHPAPAVIPSLSKNRSSSRTE